jgi:hypothetical protein
VARFVAATEGESDDLADDGVPTPRGVERRIDEDPPLVELDEDGRAPDPCDSHDVA